MLVHQIQSRLNSLANKSDAEQLQKFFKTGKGEYGEGDIFLGIRAPMLRNLVKEFKHASIDDAIQLLVSPFHEERALALFLLVYNFKREKSDAQRKIIYQHYLQHTNYINNWDLVDLSAEHIVGGFLMDKDRVPLYRLAKSKMLWERRIAMIATFKFIRHQQFDDTLKIAEVLLADQEDLIHKAVGWMLREVGKRDLAIEEQFLQQHYRHMPRTMLRYAIEKFDEEKRQGYLKK